MRKCKPQGLEKLLEENSPVLIQLFFSGVVNRLETIIEPSSLVINERISPARFSFAA